MKPLWLFAGIVLTGLAVLGAMLPVMPSTVFALGAAACFARSSPRLERWLLRQPRIGPAIIAWRMEGAVSTSAKRVALASMAVSATVVGLTAPLAVALLSGSILVASALYVGTRPAPSQVPVAG